MKIVDNLITKFSTSLLIFFDMSEAISLKLDQKKPWLLIKIILLDIFHEIFNQFFLDFYQIIERKFHPHEHSINISTFLLNPQIFFSVDKIVFLLEFFPKLFAPFG